MASGRIVVDERYCKGCELCMAVCPFQLIEMSIHYNARGYKSATLADPDRQCTGCMLCAMICPDAAITVFRERKTKPVRSPSAVVDVRGGAWL